MRESVQDVDEVVALASALIRIDTTNTGEPSGTRGERLAAEYVAERLEDAGYETTYVESGAPGRGNVIARLPGADRDRGALLVHSHLDVVPAEPSEWSVHPFSGEVSGGYVGPRRRRHEAHGGDESGRRPPVPPRRCRPAAGSGVRVPRRRGGRRG
ncbi:hypothetical protein GCM10027610_064650 [Dactylosporangium cerinum]